MGLIIALRKLDRPRCMLPFTFEAPEPSVVYAVEGCKVKRQGTTGQLKVLILVACLMLSPA